MPRLLSCLLLTACAGADGDGVTQYFIVDSEIGTVNAISGLAASRDAALVSDERPPNVWAVSDDAVSPSRIYGVNVDEDGVHVVSELLLTRESVSATYDLEGLDVDPAGGWWLAAEGDGSAPEIVTSNRLLHVDEDGEVTDEIELPDAVASQQSKYGFEGVAVDEDGAHVYVAFQGEWGDDTTGLVRIGRYTPASASWAFYAFPRCTGSGRVGLSEISLVGDGELLVLERDNLAGDESEIKHLHVASIADVEPAPADSTPPVLQARLLRDLVAEDGWPFEKAEGLGLLSSDVVIVNDNDAEEGAPTFALVVHELTDQLN